MYIIQIEILFTVMYQGEGSDYGVDSCNPCWDGDLPWNWNDQTNIAASANRCWPIGSLIVRPGCDAYLYKVSEIHTVTGNIVL